MFLIKSYFSWKKGIQLFMNFYTYVLILLTKIIFFNIIFPLFFNRYNFFFIALCWDRNQLSTIAVLVYCCGGVFLLFCYSSLPVLKHCEQMIIDFHQLSHYYNITYYLLLLTKTKTTFILTTNEKDILFGYRSRQQY